jgi:hypothetical protein
MQRTRRLGGEREKQNGGDGGARHGLDFFLE